MIRLGRKFYHLLNGRILRNKKFHLHKKGENGVNLYKDRSNNYFWLNPAKYLDQEIIKTGIFEKNTTESVQSILREGDNIIDVGANIGYYTLLFSRLVGNSGHVLAFEPTETYREILNQNIRSNSIENVSVVNLGLSNCDSVKVINIGESSATIHWTEDFKPRRKETIKLVTLDSYLENFWKLSGIKLIKADLDGHEFFFMEGAKNTIEKYNPILLIEVNQDNFFDAGINAAEFYDYLKDNNFFIYDEYRLVEFKNKRDFLLKCGNFAFSRNVFLYKGKLDGF